MPAIIVNDYTWRQNHEVVIVSMPIVGHPKQIDLFAIGNYMKASYPPFILELFLWGTIVEEFSECTIGDETAVFTLKKQEIGVEWPSLLMQDLDKQKKRAQRSRALEMAQVEAEERAKARGEKRQTLQRSAVRAQIDLDTQSFNKIEATRDSHRKEAMKDFEDWRCRAEKPILQNLTGTIQENKNAYRPPTKWFREDGPISIQKSINQSKADVLCEESGATNADGNYDAERETTKNTEAESADTLEKNRSDHENNADKETSRDLLEQQNRDSNAEPAKLDSSSDSSSSENESEDSDNCKMTTRQLISESNEKRVRREFYRRKKRESENRGREIVKRILSNEKPIFLRKSRDGIFEENGAAIPRPRTSCTIDVKFTERPFPTPARESIHLEEQEWLEKQAEARRKSGFVSEDLRPEEQDPQWLKDKGDEFFKAGNYLGAISAYSHGIKLSEKMSSLYVNRSAAHYANGNYRRCAQDCSTALELMVPKCEANRDSRARCHARLGAALCKLSAPQHGIPELEAALKLAPENETIERDLKVAKRYFEIKD